MALGCTDIWGVVHFAICCSFSVDVGRMDWFFRLPGACEENRAALLVSQIASNGLQALEGKLLAISDLKSIGSIVVTIDHGSIGLRLLGYIIFCEARSPQRLETPGWTESLDVQ